MTNSSVSVENRIPLVCNDSEPKRKKGNDIGKQKKFSDESVPKINIKEKNIQEENKDRDNKVQQREIGLRPEIKKQPIKPEISGYGFDIPGGIVGQETEIKEPELQDKNNEQISMMHLLRNFSKDNLEKYKNQKQNKDEKEKKPEKKAQNKNKRGSVLTLISLNPSHPMTVVVDKDVFNIGRKATNDAVINDLQPVSREHCSIIRERNEFYVIDRKSTFGTKVDGIPCIPGKKSSVLHEKSVIELPEISFRVEFR